MNRTVRPIALVFAVVACGSRPRGPEAVLGTGLAVTASLAGRETIKRCWGQCQYGLVCDRDSGMCVVHTPCTTACAVDERCEGGVVARCVPLLDRYRDASAADGDAAARTE